MTATQSRGRLLFKNGNYYYPLMEDEILYISADGAYTNIHLNSRKISIAKSLKEVERNLDTARFCRIHHSTVVNLEHITRFSKYDDNVVEMSDGKLLSLSKSRKKEFLDHFTKV